MSSPLRVVAYLLSSWRGEVRGGGEGILVLVSVVAPSISILTFQVCWRRGEGGGRGQRGGVPCLCGCALVPVCLTCFPVCVCAVFVHATACSEGFTVLVVFRFFYRALLVFSPSRRGFFEICAGVAEAGWTEEELNAQNRRKSDRDALATNKELLSIWREIEKHDQAWLFREPVDLAEVPDYLQVVAHPMGEFWDGGGGRGMVVMPSCYCCLRSTVLLSIPHAACHFFIQCASREAACPFSRLFLKARRPRPPHVCYYFAHFGDCETKTQLDSGRPERD